MGVIFNHNNIFFCTARYRKRFNVVSERLMCISSFVFCLYCCKCFFVKSCYRSSKIHHLVMSLAIITDSILR